MGFCALAAACAAAPVSLTDAISADDLDAVRESIEQGSDLEGPLVAGMTPLMRAANRNQAAIVDALLEAGATVDASGDDGWTALHVAARADSTTVVELLLSRGADPSIRSDSGMNALDHAAAAGAVDVLNALVAVPEIDIDQPSRAITQGHGHPRDRGLTPLGHAVRYGFIDTARALLVLGAGVDAPSASGHTPLLLAIFANQDADLVQLLLVAGADPGATAACVEGCSIGGGRPLAAAEWVVELDRTGLAHLFPLR